MTGAWSLEGGISSGKIQDENIQAKLLSRALRHSIMALTIKVNIMGHSA